MGEVKNVVSAFLATAESLGNKPFVHYEADGLWQTLTWAQARQRMLCLASKLREMGLKKGDRVIIYGQTSFDWALADFASLANGAVVVPIYHSLTAKKVAEIIQEIKPTFAFIDSGSLISAWDKALSYADVQDDITVVCMGSSVDISNISSLSTVGEISDEIYSIIDSIKSSDHATYVYTSGTTGDLKAAVLTHGNLDGEINGVGRVFLFKHEEKGLLWLPLAHVLGRMMEFYAFVYGTETVFANDISRLPEIYIKQRPHFVSGVPRMLEKMYEGVEKKVDTLSGMKKRLFKWALEVGKDYGKSQRKHKGIGPMLVLKHRIAEYLVYRKIRAGLGGNLRHIICGGAKLSEHIAGFFYAAGIQIIEGYGLTETFAAATVNRMDDFRFGTVGKPIYGVDIKIAEDGEVLIKGSIVFSEYLGDPESTKEAFTGDGWLKTGDLGEFTKDGFLRITGRKKEIIVTAGGKNIAPQSIEFYLQKSAYVTNAVVYGDGKKYLVALMILDNEAVVQYLKKHGWYDGDKTPLYKNPAVERLIAEHVENQNKELASYETIKRFSILEKPLSIEGGELTPTLKLRRKVIESKYQDVLDSLY